MAISKQRLAERERERCIGGDKRKDMKVERQKTKKEKKKSRKNETRKKMWQIKIGKKCGEKCGKKMWQIKIGRGGNALSDSPSQLELPISESHIGVQIFLSMATAAASVS